MGGGAGGWAASTPPPFKPRPLGDRQQSLQSGKKAVAERSCGPLGKSLHLFGVSASSLFFFNFVFSASLFVKWEWGHLPVGFQGRLSASASTGSLAWRVYPVIRGDENGETEAQRHCHCPRAPRERSVGSGLGSSRHVVPPRAQSSGTASVAPARGRAAARGSAVRPEQLWTDEGQQVLGQHVARADEEAGAKGGQQGLQEGGLPGPGLAPQQVLILTRGCLPRCRCGLVSGWGGRSCE